MKLSFIIATFCIALFSIHGANAQQTVSFSLCSASEHTRGDVLYLARSGKKMCWKAINGSEVRFSELATFQGSYRFVYLFSAELTDGGQGFDPVFNVQVKTLPREKDEQKNLASVELYRKGMVNLCDNRKLQIFRKKFQFDEYHRRDISGSRYNNYHLGRTGVPPRELENFHVYFRDSRGVCRKTDAKEFRQLFGISDVDFRDTPRFAAFFEKLLNPLTPSDVSASGLNQYSRITVEIGRGNFTGDALSGSFTIPSGEEHFVLINDLSSYLFDGRRRKSLQFKIVK